MRYLCDACERMAPPAAFRVELSTLVLTCARCGAETRARVEEATAAALAEAQSPSPPPPARPSGSMPPLKVVALRPSGEQVREAAELARSEDPFAVPPGFCPKCIAARKEDEPACAGCGLIYACFVPAEHRASEPLRQAWLSVLSRWDDRDAHDRLVSLAMARGELAQAGRLYRIRLAQAPDDLYAQRGRDEVVRLGLASASAALTRTQPAKGGKKLQWMLVFLIVLVVATGGFYVFRQMMDTLPMR